MDRMEEFQIPKDVIKKLKNVDLIRQEMSEGKNLKDIIGYTDETMEKFYGAAYRLFQAKEYEKASDAFLFLTTLDPQVHNYWLGLGMSEQLKKEYEGALVAYGMAVMTEMSNPVPHYHSASCYLAVGDDENAKASLLLAIEYAGEQEHFFKIKQQAESALTQLSK
ncbi:MULTISPECIES: SycD/LcrH family type III secretion system chaperone [Parachlamydia]|uniref:Type III secretion specific chlamydia chaperone 3 n=2 Tax=Parachlamydia acanthamoebae TaxID=83552 RepID=F8L143_PARAV|nr:SycD/LcrH family type III secretion system chaperone [Parachlamydia acanthamoebae]EFB42567.1 putative type III secretion chaperone SycD/LcrH [Parachlamydia acanthamoebae str. Hall's coccus]CCB86962.1 type III secretion specific chlamydia chaperone 3 [Parachlamydia acanthamoebae UV-7]